MSGADCGCGSSPGCDCGGAGSGGSYDLQSVALSMGGSIGSLVAEVAARLSVGKGASARTHARNRANAAMGAPYISADGRLIVGASSVPAGYGLTLPDPTAPTCGRSIGWRQTPLPIDVAARVAPYGP